MRRGYARLVDDEQDLDRQTDRLRAAGCRELLIERDGGQHGRVRLDEYLYDLQAGEEVVALNLGVFGRSTGKLVALLDQLAAKGVTTRVLEPRPVAIDPDRPGCDRDLLSALAAHERQCIAQRYGDRGGGRSKPRKRFLTEGEAVEALRRYREGESLTVIARSLGVARGAVTQALSGRRRVGETLYKAPGETPRRRTTALFPRSDFEIVRQSDSDDA